jgi:hypothetical protein
MSANSHLSTDKKNWLNSQLIESEQKNLDDFNFLDDYLYYIISDISKFQYDGKIYTYGSGGQGNIIVIKRENINSPFTSSSFLTNYVPLAPDHEYINGYKCVHYRDMKVEATQAEI